VELAREIAIWFCIVSGVAFSLIGGIGMIRLPDFYTRTHAASIPDTMGATLILLGLALYSGLNLITVKLVIVLFLIYVTSPTAAHALVKAAYSRGLHAPDVEAPRTSGDLSSNPEGAD